jgi:RNA polymerase sigma-70 factor (ECF subfamily)
VTEDLHDPAGPSSPPEARLDAERAIAAIQRLPEAYRETLVLRLVQGLTGPEIAAMTGLTPDSVRVNLHRGFKLLREQLGLG